jgi:8-oxo-dGTP pyrophosphatase MutT (NUDIX family)
VPKGSVDDGERPREAAIREAEEEAGLLGIVPRQPLGRYLRVKDKRPCRVDVYLMRVTNVLENWLEDKLRRRRWMRVPAATACLREEMQQFVHAVERVAELTPQRGGGRGQ